MPSFCTVDCKAYEFPHKCARRGAVRRRVRVMQAQCGTQLNIDITLISRIGAVALSPPHSPSGRPPPPPPPTHSLPPRHRRLSRGMRRHPGPARSLPTQRLGAGAGPRGPRQGGELPPAGGTPCGNDAGGVRGEGAMPGAGRPVFGAVLARARVPAGAVRAAVGVRGGGTVVFVRVRFRRER